MTTSVLSVAKRMGEQSDWKLTNLALQKLTYIAHMLHLGIYNKPLVFGSFEAWDLGPVHPQLYQAVKQFGSKHVSENVFRSIRTVQSEPESALLDKVVSTLSDNTPRLVAITHWEKGAWAKNYIPNTKRIEIPNEDILQEYRDRQSEPQY